MALFGLLWASGVTEPETGADAWYAGQKKLAKQYPLGTTIYRPDVYSKLNAPDPWSESFGGGFYCHYKITAPGKAPYDLMLSMKRRGRWWIVDR